MADACDHFKISGASRQKLIDAVQVAGDAVDSYGAAIPCLVGPSGCGKTTILAALRDEAYDVYNRRLDATLESRIEAVKTELSAGNPSVPEAIAIIERAHKSGFRAAVEPVRVVNGAELARRIRRSVETHEDVVTELAGARVLWIDDLDAIIPTDWVSQEFYCLLNRRYESERPTGFAANATPQDLTARFGDRLARRLLEGGEIIQLRS